MTIENNGGEQLTPEQIQAIISERDAAKAAADGMKNELIEERRKKQEAEAKALEIAAKSTTPPETDITKIIDERLRQRDAEDIKIAQDEAWNEFVRNNKEFDPEADKTGLRAEALKKELSRFNLSGARKKEDYLSVFNDAAMLLYKKDNKNSDNSFASFPSSSGGSPTVSDESSLSPKERETMKRLGWNLEKFNTMKVKHTELFNTLFN